MSLLRNSTWNLLGYVLPSIITIPALAVLARTLGVEKFGLFTLAFALIGYASIFDAGLSRAVIREVAICNHNEDKLRLVLGTSIRIVLVLGIFASILLWFGASSLIYILKVSLVFQEDAIRSFQYLSLCIPVFVLTQIWLAYLEGAQRFGILNWQKTITGSLIAIAPAVFVYFDNNLSSAILGLVVARILTALISFVFFFKCFPRGVQRFDRVVLNELLRFGGWITLSNIISPIMVYFDRFILSSLAGAHNVAFYTVPSEVISKLQIAPFSIARALFPKLSGNIDLNQQIDLCKKSLIWVFIVCAVIVIPVFIFSNEILVFWMGSAYAGAPGVILRILLVGFVFNSLAFVPFAQLQANGLSRVTALIHLYELIPYLFLFYVLVTNFSIVGAAIAWLIRVVADFLILMFFAGRVNR